MFPSHMQLAQEEQALQAVAVECQKISEELSSTIDKLKAAGTRKVWTSFRQAVRLYWSQDQIEETLRKLRLARENLVIHLLVVMRYG